MEKTKIIILSGFLGSGKTSLLQHLLEQEKQQGRKTAVLMNEVGDVSIDGKLLPRDTSLAEITEGCICCTGKDELERTLLTLYLDNRPDVIYIENSGIAHPLEVIDTCLTPVIAAQLEIEAVITVLDSKRWLTRTELSPPIASLIEEQVKFSTYVLINKVDFISNEEYEQIVNELQQIHPGVGYQMTTHARMDVSKMQQSALQSGQTTDHHVHHHLHVNHFVYTFEHAVDEQAFNDWVKSLPKNVFRMKGFIPFIGHEDEIAVFQFAYGMPISFLQKVKFPSTLVVIGESLQKDDMIQALNAL